MSAKEDPNEKVPMMQQLLDNPFLLLFIGVMVPMLVYTLWDVIDILTIPAAQWSPAASTSFTFLLNSGNTP